MIGRRFYLDIEKAPDHDRQHYYIDQASVYCDDNKQRFCVHSPARDTGYHVTVKGHEPAGHRCHDIPLKEHIQSYKSNQMYRVNDYSHEPYELSDHSKNRHFEVRTDFQIKTAQNHHTHCQSCVKAARYDLTVLRKECAGKQDDFQNITDNENCPACHTEISEPDEAESPIDIAECKQGQKSSDCGYRYFLKSTHNCILLMHAAQYSGEALCSAAYQSEGGFPFSSS